MLREVGFEGPLALAPQPACFCHFDLLPDNFVCARRPDGPPSVVVVDFEYCNAGQPMMDLAILGMGCNLDAAQESALFCSYLELPALSEAHLATLDVVKLLATMRETLWGVVAELSGSSALTPAEGIQILVAERDEQECNK